jgi:hypothetical protein
MTEKALTNSLAAAFISPSEANRNLEAANVVDGLCEIARALFKIARVNQEYLEFLKSQQQGS